MTIKIESILKNNIYKMLDDYKLLLSTEDKMDEQNLKYINSYLSKYMKEDLYGCHNFMEDALSIMTKLYAHRQRYKMSLYTGVKI